MLKDRTGHIKPTEITCFRLQAHHPGRASGGPYRLKLSNLMEKVKMSAATDIPMSTVDESMSGKQLLALRAGRLRKPAADGGFQ